MIYNFFKENAVRILYRHQNPELMKLYLTNGNESIPIVIIIIDQDNNIINHWGPRTKYGTALLLKHKNDPDNFPKEVFHSELHDYYDNNKGHDIINEILSLV